MSELGFVHRFERGSTASTLLLLQAKASGIELKPENVEVGDGLS